MIKMMVPTVKEIEISRGVDKFTLRAALRGEETSTPGADIRFPKLISMDFLMSTNLFELINTVDFGSDKNTESYQKFMSAFIFRGYFPPPVIVSHVPRELRDINIVAHDYHIGFYYMRLLAVEARLRDNAEELSYSFEVKVPSLGIEARLAHNGPGQLVEGVGGFGRFKEPG